jgi:hypothetical protein
MFLIKSLIKKIDRLIFKNRIKTIYRFYLDSGSLRFASAQRKFVIKYPQPKNGLADLFFKYGSDKGSPYTEPHPQTGWQPHTYSDFYEMIFRFSRFNVEKIFECGIGTTNSEILSSMGKLGMPGGSLRAWRDYFPNAVVIGADIDRDILFTEERIQTYFLDQTDPYGVKEFWKNLKLENFDIMVDDGLHLFEAGRTLFENSYAKLRDGGIYIIEDILMTDKKKYQEYFEASEYDFYFIDLLRPNVNLFDNSLVMISKNTRQTSR